MGEYTFIQDEARNDKVTVGTTSQVIAFARTEANPRKTILIRNISTSDQIITINMGLSQAQNDTGIVLKPNESFSDSTETGYKCFQGTISAISDTADGVLAILER